MTNHEIMKVAMEQSAIDLHCDCSDFEAGENIIVYSQKHEKARKYLELPFECNLVSYGSNIVASIQQEYYDIVNSYLSKQDVSHCFETPDMYVINDAFVPFGLKIRFMAEYFLPDLDHLKMQPCEYEIRIMEQKDFSGLYTEKWSNALCEDRKELDVLGAGAFHNGTLIGLAAEALQRGKIPFYCSAWCNLKSVRNALKSGFKPAWVEMTVKPVNWQ